jgi:hypothetical protein
MHVLALCLAEGMSEHKFPYIIPVKQIPVASCYSVTCWYMVSRWQIYSPVQETRPVQCQLENGDCTELMDKERGVWCYPIPVGTTPRTQTDCGCIWHRYDTNLGSAEVVLWLCKWSCVSWARTKVVIQQHVCHSHRSNGVDRQIYIMKAIKNWHLTSHTALFVKLFMNASAVTKCSADGCQNNCPTIKSLAEWPRHWLNSSVTKLKAMTFVAHHHQWWDVGA